MPNRQQRALSTELATTDIFQRIIVQFNSETLEIESISADKRVNNNPLDPTDISWNPVGEINPIRVSEVEVPGVYDTNSVIFRHCLSLLEATRSTVELRYSMNGRVEIPVDEILADNNKKLTYASFLHRDPFYTALEERKRINVTTKIEETPPTDKVFYQYGTAEIPVVSLPTITSLQLADIFTAMQNIGWHPTEALALNAVTDPAHKTLHRFMITYSVSADKTHYIIEGRRVENLADVTFKICSPIKRKEN